MIELGARGYNQDGSGGEIAIYWRGCHRDVTLLLLRPSKFSYWLFNEWVHLRQSLMRFKWKVNYSLSLTKAKEVKPERLPEPPRHEPYEWMN